ncbi:MAG TPA: hypothetical protein VGK67_39665 [Myxococcales bacterium]|jgi:predicted transcriptional regulator
MSEKANLAVKLDPVLHARLKALGLARKRSAHWLMCEAIRRYLEQEEESDRARQEALERLARFDETGKYIAHEDVDAWLKSWGSDSELPAPKRTRKWKR